MRKRMTQVMCCVCTDIFCCWAHSLLPTSHHVVHHIIVLRECTPSDFDKIIHSLVYFCECVVGYQCRSCMWPHSDVSSGAYLRISIHTSFAPVLTFPTLVSINCQRTRENLEFVRHTYTLSHNLQLSNDLNFWNRDRDFHIIFLWWWILGLHSRHQEVQR